MLKKDQLHGYQRTVVEHIKNNSHCGLFLDMGLGKTVSSLTAINFLTYEDAEIEKTLVIAPKRVIESVWQEETQKWEHLTHLVVEKVVGTPKKRLQALQRDADIYLVSRDNVFWLSQQYTPSKFPFRMCVIDEMSSFKNSKTMRFKALRRMRPHFIRIVGLTGTPAPNSLLDLWSQVYLLDAGERLGQFKGRYRDEYFIPDARSRDIIYSYKPAEGSEEAIHEKIGDICISMKAEDYLDMPKKIENDIMLDLPDKVIKQYETLEAEKILEFIQENEIQNSSDIVAVNAAALSNKLLQLCNGAVYNDDGSFTEFHEVKLKALREIIEELNGQPVLVAYNFRHDKERILKHIKEFNPVVLDGKEDIENWNAGKIRVMLLHPASGGHGLNLQKGGSNIIWFGCSWSLELTEQYNARLFRQGQTKPVIIHRLLIKDTVDVEVVQALADKTTTQNKLMEAVKSKVKQYLKTMKS